MTVYVRWYGKVLEGELLEGDHLGMKQVRIPLDGHHPVALFMPGHICDSPEQVTEKILNKHTNLEELCAKTQENYTKSPEIEQKQPEIAQNIAVNDVLPADDPQSIEAFKQANWDHDRGHLRIDKLDEFYQLWRMYMVPFGYVEAVHDSCTPKEPAAITLPYREITNSTDSNKLSKKMNSMDSNKPSKKMLRSTGQQQFADSTQLSIFD